MTPWIRRTERLPEMERASDGSMWESAPVLVIAFRPGTRETDFFIGRLNKFKADDEPEWEIDNYGEVWLPLDHVVSWMPLPEPPPQEGA